MNQRVFIYGHIYITEGKTKDEETKEEPEDPTYAMFRQVMKIQNKEIDEITQRIADGIRSQTPAVVKPEPVRTVDTVDSDLVPSDPRLRLGRRRYHNIKGNPDCPTSTKIADLAAEQLRPIDWGKRRESVVPKSPVLPILKKRTSISPGETSPSPSSPTVKNVPKAFPSLSTSGFVIPKVPRTVSKNPSAAADDDWDVPSSVSNTKRKQKDDEWDTPKTGRQRQDFHSKMNRQKAEGNRPATASVDDNWDTPINTSSAGKQVSTSADSNWDDEPVGLSTPMKQNSKSANASWGSDPFVKPAPKPSSGSDKQEVDEWGDPPSAVKVEGINSKPKGTGSEDSKSKPASSGWDDDWNSAKPKPEGSKSVSISSVTDEWGLSGSGNATKSTKTAADDDWGAPPGSSAHKATKPAEDEWGAPKATKPAEDEWGAPKATKPAEDEWGAPKVTKPADDDWGGPASTVSKSGAASDDWGAPAGGASSSSGGADDWSAPAPSRGGDDWGR
jgi:hypothetical protein